MTWLTENPWPLLLILAGAAATAMVSGAPKARSFSIVCLLAAFGVYLVESVVVTPGEEVETQLQTMLGAFQDRNQGSIDRMIADESPKLRETAAQGLELVTLGNDFHIKDLEVSVRADGRTADAHLRANGTLTVTQGGMDARVFTRWHTMWKLIGTEWKLAEVKRLDPVNSQEIGILDPR